MLLAIIGAFFFTSPGAYVSESRANVIVNKSSHEPSLDYFLIPASEDSALTNGFQPISMFEQWKKVHGNKALEKETDSNGRRYIIVKYSCPRQTGNLIRDVITPLIQAIVTKTGDCDKEMFQDLMVVSMQTHDYVVGARRASTA